MENVYFVNNIFTKINFFAPHEYHEIKSLRFARKNKNGLQ